MFNLQPLISQFNQFSQIQSQNQQQMIALLRKISLDLEQIKNHLQNQNYVKK